jgi:cation diffusion facilitator family transporter
MDRNVAQQQMISRGMKTSLLGMVLNFLLAGVKMIAGLFGHSYALVADGVESLSDVISSFVVYLGLKVALKPPDKDHPYGHGKAEPIAAFIVGLMLVIAAFVIAAQALQQIRTPHPLPAKYTLAVLIGVVVLKASLSRYVQKVGIEIESTAVAADAWHHRSDAITSAFAFAGISVALILGPGHEAADDWAALAASAIILYNAARQIRPALLELTDVSPSSELEDKIRASASSVHDVLGLHRCLIRKMGFSYFVDLHVIVRGDMTVRQGHSIAHEVQDVVTQDLPQVAQVLVHIEPEENLRFPNKQS